MRNMVKCSLALAVLCLQPISARADATIGTKEVNANILAKHRRMVAAKDDSSELCAAVLRSPRAKARMCELLKQDPEARQLLGMK